MSQRDNSDHPIFTHRATDTEGFGGFGSGFNLERYKHHVARIESGGRDHAKSQTSSATGRYQFTKDTWHLVSGESFSQARNPHAADRAMDKLTMRNYDYLQHALGRNPAEWECYVCHFAGPKTAAKVLEADADTRLSQIFTGNAMHANPHLARLGTAGNYRHWVKNHYEHGGSSGVDVARSGGGFFAASFGGGHHGDNDHEGTNLGLSWRMQGANTGYSLKGRTRFKHHGDDVVAGNDDHPQHHDKKHKGLHVAQAEHGDLGNLPSPHHDKQHKRLIRSPREA